ncbi:MAG: hypothetical protein JXA42_10085 [Anaerolineales bacterium]|nr:hypothetical protein [Anaerolineales bacterium]
MVGKAGVKAGLIGAAIMVVFALIGFIPIVSCICLCVGWLAYVGVGALSAKFLDETAENADGAKAGAIAGLISGVGYGIVSSIVSVIQGSSVAFNEILMRPEFYELFSELDIDPSMLVGATSPTAIGVSSLCCCLSSLLVGAGLGALGGILFMSISRKE